MKKTVLKGEMADEIIKCMESISAKKMTINSLSLEIKREDENMWEYVTKEYPNVKSGAYVNVDHDNKKVTIIDRMANDDDY